MGRMVLGVLCIALASPVSAQNRPTLDDPIVGEFSVPNPLPPCGLKTAMNRLAQKTRVLVGFEETRDCVGLGNFGGGNSESGRHDRTAGTRLPNGPRPNVCLAGPGWGCGRSTGGARRNDQGMR